MMSDGYPNESTSPTPRDPGAVRSGPASTRSVKLIADPVPPAEVVPMAGAKASEAVEAFTVGGRLFTVGAEVAWRGAKWIVEGPDARTSRAGRPCLKLKGYRFGVDAREVT